MVTLELAILTRGPESRLKDDNHKLSDGQQDEARIAGMYEDSNLICMRNGAMASRTNQRWKKSTQVREKSTTTRKMKKTRMKS